MKFWKLVIAGILGILLATILLAALSAAIVFLAGTFFGSILDTVTIFKILGSIIGLIFLSLQVAKNILTNANR